MTVAVYIPSEGVIAYDSRLTQGTLIVSDDIEKLLDFGDIKLIAACDMGDERRIAESFIDESAHYAEEFQAFVVDRDNDVYLFERGEKSNKSMRLDFPCAIGAGAPFATVGIKLGMKAVQCVELAIQNNTECGGRIRTISL